MTFGAQQITASVSVPITNDFNIENTEVFHGALTTLEQNVEIGEDTADITIIDEDGEIVLIAIQYFHCFLLH